MFQQANPGVVTTLENRMHGLQTGDKVTFKEIVGMTALNGSEQTVKGYKYMLTWDQALFSFLFENYIP